MLRRWFRDLIGLLFPELCAACASHLYRGEYQLCTRCLHELPYSDHDVYADNTAAMKFWGRLELGRVFALLHFRKGSRVQNMLHTLKYKNRPDLGLELGRMIGEKLALTPGLTDLAGIVPVPLYKTREKMRGYNQSMLIAKGISEKLSLPVIADSLVRIRATESQTKKGRFSRHENMVGVFGLKTTEAIDGKHVLLVDDVMTTGATLEACAEVLFKSGASKISIAAVAFAD